MTVGNGVRERTCQVRSVNVQESVAFSPHTSLSCNLVIMHISRYSKAMVGGHYPWLFLSKCVSQTSTALRLFLTFPNWHHLPSHLNELKWMAVFKHLLCECCKIHSSRHHHPHFSSTTIIHRTEFRAVNICLHVFSSSWAISNPKRWCCESAALNLPANSENSAVATGLEKVSFHSNPKERQCQRMLKVLHNCFSQLILKS